MLANDTPVTTFLYFRLLHYLKPLKLHFKIKGYIIKQYAVIAMIMMAVFLPVRLVFYTYVTTNWLGNLGVMSAIAIIMFVLIEKNKLGWFGVYFKNRVRRLVFHRIFWLALVISIYHISLWGFFLWEIDKTESGYFGDDLEFVLAMIVYDDEMNESLHDVLNEYDLYPSDEALISYGAGIADNSTNDRVLALIQKDDGLYFMDMLFSVSLYELNQKYGAWGSHFVTVFLVEELEAIFLLLFYRRAYFKKAGLSWHKELDLYPKNIRKMTKWYNKKPAKKIEVIPNVK